MKEYEGNPESADTTCWIECECGERLFIYDEVKHCPVCGRGYKVKFTVIQYEPEEMEAE